MDGKPLTKASTIEKATNLPSAFRAWRGTSKRSRQRYLRQFTPTRLESVDRAGSHSIACALPYAAIWKCACSNDSGANSNRVGRRLAKVARKIPRHRLFMHEIGMFNDVLADCVSRGYLTNKWLGPRHHSASCATDCLSKVYRASNDG